MSTLQVRNQQGQVVGEREIANHLTEAPVHTAAMHQVVVAQLANRRRGTACTKTRGDVHGSTRKLYRQKGTGRARMGSNRAPVRVGGGVAFGPKPRSFRQATPKKVKHLAFQAAIADKLQTEAVVLLESLSFEKPRTKELVSLLSRLNIDSSKILLVLAEDDRNVYLSARNIPSVNVTTVSRLNTYEVLWHDALVMTQEGMAGIEQRCLSATTVSSEADLVESVSETEEAAAV